MLAEVLSLADLAGMCRFVEEWHPGIAAMLASTSASSRKSDDGQAGSTQRARTTRSPTSAQPKAPGETASMASPGGLLTPKEARILSLLAVGRANKEIARAMDIGDQTVKWHLKNVFTKLNAASRKHAVDRARLLGLLVD